jgi:hypothetical protein
VNVTDSSTLLMPRIGAVVEEAGYRLDEDHDEEENANDYVIVVVL